MGKLLYLSWFLVLLLASKALAQDDAAADDAAGDDGGAADGDGGDAATAKSADGECEEAWEYVDFLKDDVIGKATEILTSFKDATNIEKTVDETMQKVMGIREALLMRIKDIRKEEVTICPEQNIKQEQKLSEFRQDIMSVLLKLVAADTATTDSLKEIGNDLLRFKTTVGQEVMRLLMLPENKVSVVPQGDCSECASLDDLNKQLEKLKECAAKDDEDEAEDGGDDAAATEQAAEGGDGSGDEECPEPQMYSMQLITATENVDKEISNLYTRVRAEEDPTKKDTLFRTLTSYKELREQIEEIIVKLLNEKGGDDKIKKTLDRSLRRLLLELQNLLKKCLSQCGSSGCGDSCGAKVLDDTIAKMKDYKAFIEDDQREDEEKKEFVRGELIKLINDNNNDARDILIKTANSIDGETEPCDKEKFDIYDTMKGPMWMLVNNTIFGETAEVQVLVNAMIEQLEVLLEKYCGADPVIPTSIEDGPNCEWEEYEQSKKYLEKLDEIIQDAIFKAKEDKDKLKAVLGFVDIQQMFDNRVKKLFEDELKCPDEVTIIKKEYMVQLNTCMKEFLSPKVKFSEMSRIQRISCIKGLRNAMEDRSARLLQFELEKSLNGIEDSQISQQPTEG